MLLKSELCLVCDTLSPRAGNVHVTELLCQIPQKHLVPIHPVGSLSQTLGVFCFSPSHQDFLQLWLVSCSDNRKLLGGLCLSKIKFQEGLDSLKRENVLFSRILRCLSKQFLLVIFSDLTILLMVSLHLSTP